jgi:hypothetical protein
VALAADLRNRWCGLAADLRPGRASKHIVNECGLVAAVARVHLQREAGVSVSCQPGERRRGELEGSADAA